jgi:RNA polymerase sigma factor (TIGR02999 family)
VNTPQDITLLLQAWGGGDPAALDRLLPLVERELRQLAKGYLRQARVNHSLQTTELINQTFLKLVEQKRVRWKNRAHFFGVAAICMRRALLDYVKARRREKRGGGAEHVALSDAPPVSDEQAAELRRCGSWRGRMSVRLASSSCASSAVTASKRWLASLTRLRERSSASGASRVPGCVAN